MQAPDKRSHEVSLTLKVVRHCLLKKDDYLFSRQVSVGSLPDSLHGLDLLPNPTFKVFLNLSTSDLRKDPPTTFAALTLLQSSRTTTNKLTPALLSWDSSNSPPPRTLCVSTPSQCCHRPSAYRYYAVSHVLPSWFRTTSTAYSTQSLRAYCIPLSTVGFATFPL